MRHVELRSGVYRDSVQLMQISAELSRLPGVEQAFVAMATGLNLELVTGMGFQLDHPAAADDLVVAVAVADEATLAATLTELDVALSGGDRSSSFAVAAAVETAGQAPPRTTATAVRALGAPGARVALISTPGRYAFLEAMDALGAGAHVMLFSDNVDLAQEIALKREAQRRGLLVMGPDCGTAVIGGVGLGFANVVHTGPVGLVAASGTGAQQVMSLLGWAGVGVSACIGVGSRDMSAAVGAVSTLAAIDILDADPATELILITGKPPDPAVASVVRDRVAALRTPALFAPLGQWAGSQQPDLTAVTESVLARLGIAVPDPWPRWLPKTPQPLGTGGRDGGFLRGLFCGGTLCAEALAIVESGLGSARSNLHDPAPSGAGHELTDLGADEYTVGRPHPMIDTGPRVELIAKHADDPSCRVLLLDVVLGQVAHPDPAGELAPAVQRALDLRREHPLSIVVALVGTPQDPQDPLRQAAALQAAGASVFISNAEATRYAVNRIDGALWPMS